MFVSPEFRIEPIATLAPSAFHKVGLRKFERISKEEKMKIIFSCLLFCVLCSCGESLEKPSAAKEASQGNIGDDYTMVFASCNDQDRPQPLWKPILQNEPDLFVWGGDNVYADTEDMSKMKSDYDKVLAQANYKELIKQTAITGTWDDHDYGANDAGVEFEYKEESKKLLLDFLQVPENDIRRTRPGVYTAETYETPKGSIKLLLLDTRTFRDSLQKSKDPNLRYDPWKGSEGGTILGEAQWEWLEQELQDETPSFTLIVTSIQFLSDQHGWEKWGNHPSEVEKMQQLLLAAKAKNIAMLSGDRHLAEVSVATLPGMSYPLVDFTASGLTHTYIDTPTEGNPYRVSNVVKRINFGVLRFDFDENQIIFEIRGEDNFLFERFVQQY